MRSAQYQKHKKRPFLYWVGLKLKLNGYYPDSWTKWTVPLDPKSGATLFNRYSTTQTLWRLSNGILCIFVAKVATKLQEVKVWVQKQDFANHANIIRKRGST